MLSDTYTMIEALHTLRPMLDTFLYTDMKVVGGYMDGKIILNVRRRDGHQVIMSVIKYVEHTGISLWAFGPGASPDFATETYVVQGDRLIYDH